MSEPKRVTDITKIPEEDAVELISKARNCSEIEARHELRIVKGEIKGDIATPKTRRLYEDV